MKKTYKLLPLFIVALVFSSCTSIHKTMKQPNSLVDIKMSDFKLSEQKSGKATSVLILGIDLERLFMTKTADFGISAASIPIVGQYLADPTSSYAMYNLLEGSEGGDFVFYPQMEKKTQCPFIGLCILSKITTVNVKARVGTFK